jgi:hypothetical protein
MSELRDLVLNAHGGIARWRKLKTIEGGMSITGAFWARKGWSDATHCSEKVFHIGSDGLISRLDYSATVTGGIPIAHYSSDYRDFDGIKLATGRRAYRRNPDGTALTNFTAVAIDRRHPPLVRRGPGRN